MINFKLMKFINIIIQGISSTDYRGINLAMKQIFF